MMPCTRNQNSRATILTVAGSFIRGRHRHGGAEIRYNRLEDSGTDPVKQFTTAWVLVTRGGERIRNPRIRMAVGPWWF